MMSNLTLYSLFIGIVGLVATFLTFAGIRQKPAGSEVMKDLAEQIHLGAMAFLKAEYRILLPFILVIAGLLAWAVDPKTAIAYVFGFFVLLLLLGWEPGVVR